MAGILARTLARILAQSDPGSDPSSDPGFILSLSRKLKEASRRNETLIQCNSIKGRLTGFICARGR